MLLTGVAALAAPIADPRHRLAVPARTGLALAAAALPLGSWAAREGAWATVALAAAAVLAVWLAADAWSARSEGLRASASLLAAATGAAVALVLGHSAKLGILAAGVAPGLVVAAVVAAVRPRTVLPAGAVAVVAVVLGGTVVQGIVFADLPLASALLLGVALLAPGLPWPRASTDTGSAGRAFAGALLALVPATAAAWIAWRPGESF